MYVLIDNEKVIRAICSNDGIIESDESGIVWINGAGYGLTGQQLCELDDIPAYVSIDRYKYVDDGFIVNTDYYNPDEELITLVENVNMLIEVQADILGGAI